MKNIFLLAILAVFTFNTSAIFAQETSNQEAPKQETPKAETTKPGPNFPKIDASPMDLALYRDSNNEALARVIYSRPQKRDREIFGKLVPYGEVWRTGANETTELTLFKDMKVADATVKAGTYTVYTIPQEKEWTIILNNRIHTWGALEYTDKQDLVRIKVPVRQSPTSIEAFSMAFAPNENGANLLMGWDDKYVEVPFKKIN